MIDTRLNFKQQVEHVATKASGVRTLIPPHAKHSRSHKKRRALLSTVVTSVLSYGIPIWADALQFQESRRKTASVYRQSTPRVASAYRTVSEDAVCVIAGMLPIEVLAEDRRCLYRRRRYSTLSPKDLREEERRYSTSRWQVLWDTSAKGRCSQDMDASGSIFINSNLKRPRSARPAVEKERMLSTCFSGANASHGFAVAGRLQWNRESHLKT
ncbi:uncharacterized protein LOC107046315 [Diachasma alloeum]|uniref:uncharacterized protein LOC107046315 n=1 Tax=Diachasma alloeum TaxID=454923 RepID=UPI00073831C5|nr:uncharacterized protein LOC107046315 [Diachasma alloeum]